MSSVVISGDTSGAITLTAPAVSGTNTITLPASTGTVLTTGSPQSGGVIQVVSASPTLSFSTASGSFTTTGLTASITPKFSTSKILVIVTAAMDTQSSNLATQNAIYRGGSSVFNFNGQYAASAGYMQTGNSAHYLDSPATTTSTTYTLYSRISAGAGTTASTSLATITLMEIAA